MTMVPTKSQLDEVLGGFDGVELINTLCCNSCSGRAATGPYCYYHAQSRERAAESGELLSWPADR